MSDQDKKRESRLRSSKVCEIGTALPRDPAHPFGCKSLSNDAVILEHLQLFGVVS